MSYDELRTRRHSVKWRDVFAHNSSRTCAGCRHFTDSQRFCEKAQMLTLPGATCRQFSKPTDKLKPRS